ncbi:hypothetical protein [Ruegeria atlantica]|uniref:hypothetical protein n=1 Tax=Ruegeria atlantica TaxID=81569 RepID=UPI0020C55139|nr:hypothetical protein [Ruegeria atlantica]
MNELTAAFGAVGARRLLEEIDRDGDDRITITELRGGEADRKGGSSERDEREDGDHDDDGPDERDQDNERDDDGDDGGDDD